jgi:methanethiol S-methyltransferase
MALTFDRAWAPTDTRRASVLGLAYAWSGIAVMWAVWACFVVFLADPRWAAAYWPLQTVNGGVPGKPALAAMVDILLIALFGVQHSLMARPWFKAWWARSVPPAFERCTFVHLANVALLALILFWQPLPVVLWDLRDTMLRDVLWSAFGLGWIILFAGAWSFGLGELLGLAQMRRWARGEPARGTTLKTGRLYRWIRNPMYAGVLLGVWATPIMTAGHALLAAGFTIYVAIAMRYEERDLVRQHGRSYERWRSTLVLAARDGTAQRRRD